MIDYTLLMLAVVTVGSGLFAGVIAGMLGVGGGIVLVPTLEYLLRHAGVPAEARMHVAVATSLATIIPTAIASSRAHHRRGAVDWALVRSWAPGLAIGALAGAAVAAAAQTRVLTAVFGAVCLAMAAKMLAPLDDWRLRAIVPRGAAGNAIGAAIGGVSAMMGIGGGTLGVPVMNVLGHNVHTSVGTASFFGLLIGLPGTLAYLTARPETPLPPLTIGFVSLIGFALIAPATIYAAPIGARLAHSLSRRHLARAFGVFLCIVAARMGYRTFVAG
ncbi:MAG: sulfite exporter TauE/SafE family protein [Steroidobacteraceae bacterium]|nr:sulfite exporter TauE/SafE family protein [Steroidobacteraceae bacterium]MDW8259765.1 sulfite exporter TauE/SafE family protein [Gammaproteobacteria bacterium]